MIIKLKKNQFDYLNSALSEEQGALRSKLKQVTADIRSVIIEVDECIVDEIRDWASNELQRKGFDINYELTSEGKILEELVDMFYIE